VPFLLIIFRATALYVHPYLPTQFSKPNNLANERPPGAEHNALQGRPPSAGLGRSCHVHCYDQQSETFLDILAQLQGRRTPEETQPSRGQLPTRQTSRHANTTTRLYRAPAGYTDALAFASACFKCRGSSQRGYATAATSSCCCYGYGYSWTDDDDDDDDDYSSHINQ
jgi:hypothetical protein